jgi:hypothetical protein
MGVAEEAADFVEVGMITATEVVVAGSGGNALIESASCDLLNRLRHRLQGIDIDLIDARIHPMPVRAWLPRAWGCFVEGVPNLEVGPKNRSMFSHALLLDPCMKLNDTVGSWMLLLMNPTRCASPMAARWKHG